MSKNREEIMQDMLRLLRQLAEDWEYAGDVTPETRFFTDLKLASLDVVVLGASIQEYYEQVLPFADFYAEVGRRERPDVSVGEWVDFIFKHLKDAAAPNPGRGGATR
jgi:acyl carrier protein